MYSKARATKLTGYKFTAHFPKKKYIVHKFPTELKIDLITNHFTRVTKKVLHLNLDNCKNELLRLNLTRNKKTDRKIVNFQVFADSVHQAELERYQGHIQLEEKYPYNGAHGQ